jgi:selenocysteine-specific elongation factor
MASRSIVVGTAGHIDHGKSALVRALTGIDPDRLQEEKARGITIDLGFAHCDLDGVRIAFVDVPGHERFVRNMLAGVGGIDAVLLVVAADESVMPQTREHFDICRLLRIPAGIVALTKADLVDEDTLELVRLEVRELLEGSPLAAAPLVAVSARSGEGLPALRRALRDLAAAAARRGSAGATRLPIDRVFSMRGFGTVVTGTLVSGRIREDDELIVLPSGRRVKVRGVQVHGRREAAAEAGQRAAVNLGGVEVTELARGETLAAAGAFEPSRRFDAVVELLPGARPLRHGARVRLHQGTSELFGRVALAGLSPDGPSAAGELPPGARAFARLRLEAPAIVTRGDRFILRAYSPPMTIGGGQVLDPDPSRGPIRTAGAHARFRALAGASDADGGEEAALQAMLLERGPAGIPKAALVSRLGVPPERMETFLAGLEQGGRVVRTGEWLVSAGVLEKLEERLLKELGAYHRTQPLSDGMPREEARERLFGPAPAALFEAVLARLLAANRIVARDRLALAGHRLSLSQEESEAAGTLERLFREGGLKPPDAASLPAAAGLPPPLIERMLALLVRQKRLVRLEGLVFHRDALEQLKVEVAGLKTGAAAARVDVAAFKARYGISRKYAIPLLEFLDRERVTRRVGEARVVL